MNSARKSVLITGCSAGGAGAALAEVFQEKGYHVFATARTPLKISQSFREASNVTVLTLDVLSSESIAAAVKSVSAETGGKLDVLVNNSGSGIILPTLDTSIEEAKKLFDLNFWACFAMIQAFAPLLQSGGGYVVNMASVSGLVPIMFNRRALIIASETLRLELAPLGIRTLTLITAGIKTNYFQNMKPTPIPEQSYYFGVRDFIEGLGDGRMQENGCTPREFATKVVREVERGTTGKLWVGGGATGARWGHWLLPQFLMDRLLESMMPVSARIANDIKTKKA